MPLVAQRDHFTCNVEPWETGVERVVVPRARFSWAGVDRWMDRQRWLRQCVRWLLAFNIATDGLLFALGVRGVSEALVWLVLNGVWLAMLWPDDAARRSRGGG